MRKRWFFIAPAIWVVVLGLLLGLSTLGEQAPYVVLFGLVVAFVGIVGAI